MNTFEEYAERFNENFPIFAEMPEGKTCEQVAKECLKTGRPFVPEYDKDKIY